MEVDAAVVISPWVIIIHVCGHGRGYARSDSGI